MTKKRRLLMKILIHTATLMIDEKKNEKNYENDSDY